MPLRPAWPTAVPMLMKAVRRLHAAERFCFGLLKERGLFELRLADRRYDKFALNDSYGAGVQVGRDRAAIRRLHHHP